LSTKKYHPEEYWSDLARRTANQEYGVAAGDVEPFYAYKRDKFLELFRKIDFKDKKVLEVGCGPGSNLKEVMRKNPIQLCAVDISNEMIAEAKKNTRGEVEIRKTNGIDIDFDDNSFDIVFTVTVLQHNTDKAMLEGLVESICRVSRSEVYFFERIEKTSKGTDLNMGHPVSYYSNLMSKGGYKLVDVEFLNIEASYLMAGVTRKVLNSRNRKEGDPLNNFSLNVQRMCLPLTKGLDRFIKRERELAMLHYSLI